MSDLMWFVLGVAVGQAALVVVLALFHDAGDVPAQERS